MKYASAIHSQKARRRSAGRYRAKVPTFDDIQSIRLANLLLLLDEVGSGRGSRAKLSRLTGVPQPYISQLKKATAHSSGANRTMGDETARRLEKGMSKPNGWMDHDHQEGPADDVRRLMAIIAALKPAQRMAIEQTAAAFAESNAAPPPDDGPEIRAPARPASTEASAFLAQG